MASWVCEWVVVGVVDDSAVDGRMRSLPVYDWESLELTVFVILLEDVDDGVRCIFVKFASSVVENTGVRISLRHRNEHGLKYRVVERETH